MHKIVYQVCSPLVISASPNSDSAFLAGTFLRYMAPRARQPRRYQNRSAEVKPVVPVAPACGAGWRPRWSYCRGISGWASGGGHCCRTWVWSAGARACGACACGACGCESADAHGCGSVCRGECGCPAVPRPDSCGCDSDIAISLTFGDVDG